MILTSWKVGPSQYASTPTPMIFYDPHGNHKNGLRRVAREGLCRLFSWIPNQIEAPNNLSSMPPCSKAPRGSQAQANDLETSPKPIQGYDHVSKPTHRGFGCDSKAHPRIGPEVTLPSLQHKCKQNYLRDPRYTCQAHASGPKPKTNHLEASPNFCLQARWLFVWLAGDRSSSIYPYIERVEYYSDIFLRGGCLHVCVLVVVAICVEKVCGFVYTSWRSVRFLAICC